MPEVVLTTSPVEPELRSRNEICGLVRIIVTPLSLEASGVIVSELRSFMDSPFRVTATFRPGVVVLLASKVRPLPQPEMDCYTGQFCRYFPTGSLQGS